MAKTATRNPQTTPAEEMLAEADRARREGRHFTGKPTANCICSVCRQPALAYVGRDGVDVCETCYRANKAKYEPESPVARATSIPSANSKLIERLRKYLPTLEDEMILWASRNAVPAYRAYYAAGRELERKILARLVRDRAAADPGWLVRYAGGPNGRALADLGQLIVRAGGYPLPGTFDTFADWVKAVAEAP